MVLYIGGVLGSREDEVPGVSVGRGISWESFVFVGRRMGEWEREEGEALRFRAARDLRGEALRMESEVPESMLPWVMSWRQVMMRSLGGCVDTLSRRDRLVREIMLLGRPMTDARFIRVLSHCSLCRIRFWNAQSCRNTLRAPV